MSDTDALNIYGSCIMKFETSRWTQLLFFSLFVFGFSQDCNVLHYITTAELGHTHIGVVLLNWFLFICVAVTGPAVYTTD